MKRVLYVTYYFPPSGGSGVQRGLKMVKYLPAEGWEPVVLSVHPDHASWPDRDPAMLTDVPADIHVERTGAWDPYSAYARFVGKSKNDAVGVGFLGADHASPKEKLARWVRANIFLPDARVGWVRHALKAARRLAREYPLDAIVTTGPPHSAHLIGQRLARETGLPWVADCRDAWPDPAYAEMLPTSAWARRKDLRIRDRALKAASRRIAVTDDLAAHMRTATGVSFDVIRNGFDPADFPGGVGSGTPDTGHFLLTHTGNLGPARDPEPLWNVLSDPDSRQRWPKLRLALIGNVDPTIQQAMDGAGVLDRVIREPYVPHHEAIDWMQRSALLLLPINRVMESAGIVTGKIYEYLASGRPVLALGEPGGEADQILRETQAGHLLAYTDVDGLAAELDRHYSAWASGRALSGAPADRLDPYSRKSQAGSLARILEELTTQPSRPESP